MSDRDPDARALADEIERLHLTERAARETRAHLGTGAAIAVHETARRELDLALRNAAPQLAAAVRLAGACAEYHDSGKEVDRRAECLAAYRATLAAMGAKP